MTLSPRQQSMNTHSQFLTEQITRLAESTPGKFFETLDSLAQETLIKYSLDRLSLFPSSPILLSRGDIYSTSLDKQRAFSFEQYDIEEFKQYIKILKTVKHYLAFNCFELMLTETGPLSHLRAQGVKFHAMIPISINGRSWGALTVSSFSQINMDLEDNRLAWELQALGNLWLCFWKQMAALQSTSVAGDTCPHSEKEKLTSLPKRQRQVLSLLGQGLTVTECAERLSISRRTVESHKYRMQKTLDIKTHNELMKLVSNHPIDF